MTAGIPTVECTCVDVEIGSYSNQVEMRTPQGKQACIDTCIATIIAWLWHHDVVTLNSCCGHHKEHNGRYLTPSVIVSTGSVQVMNDFGFRLDDSGSVVPEQTFSLVRPHLGYRKDSTP